jgi:hypothetical protein
MQNKYRKYIMLAVALGILIPINYFIFKGNPSDAVEVVEEEVINDVTGVKIDLNGDGK